MKIYDGRDEGATAAEGTALGESLERRSVGVADFAVTDGSAVLVTSGLGSCVAVGVTDGTTAGGLLHVMLPSAKDRQVQNPAKYADTGVRRLIEGLRQEGATADSLVAKMAGGSEMISFSSQERSIGDRNAEAVRRALESADVPLVGQDIGGEEGRTVEFSLRGEFKITTARDGERVL